MVTKDDEILFVGTAEAEHVEMYLKAIWHIKERNEEVKISTIAKMLNVRQPSVVQMLKKLNDKQLVTYNKAGVSLTENGETIGSSMMRNSRLLEVLMDSALKVEIDEEMVCGIEHHMNKQFTNALCTMLKHPRKCPHDHEIPLGECCTKNETDWQDLIVREWFNLACFCGCENFEKNPNGRFLACVKCGHGRQNHDDEFRASARMNEEQSQKRDSDFG